jgi:hypothetical protein
MDRLSAGARLFVPLIAVVAFACSAQSIQPRAPMPSFEVASVKPWSAAPVVVGADGPQKPVKLAPLGAAPAITDRVHFIGQIELLIEAAYSFPLASTSGLWAARSGCGASPIAMR